MKDDKETRKKLKLPLTKQLVYYDIRKIKYNVDSYKILRQKNDCIILEIILNNNNKVNILLDYFRQMQQKNFLKNKERELKEINYEF